jgi:UDP-N-acetylmuramate--alanine ligase
MLSEIMNGSFSIAIAGTHGKTSTTSLIGCILETAGFDPTVVIGGEVAVFGGNSKLGFGSHVVVEADESDGSLLYLSPRFAVITNIDNDHMDYYQDANHLDKTFLAFIHRVDHDGLVVLCSDCERTRQLIPDIKRKIVTYGFDPEHAVFTARNIQLNVDGSKFSLYRRSRYLYDVSLAVPGRHSILNTLAAIAISEALNVPVPSILQALATFSGAGRRFQTIGEHKEIKIIDDYAHHPTEVKVTMETAKQVCEGRIISVFQPHRYTRTKQFSKEFAQALLSGDLVIIDQIYAASEEPIEGINSELLVSLMKEAGHKNVMHLSGAEAITTYLLENLQPKDLVLTIGAGDITYLGPSLLAKLKEGNVDSKVTFAA